MRPRHELERASRLFRFEGRFDDVRNIIRGSWSRSPTPASDLKELWTLDHSPMPVEAWKLRRSTRPTARTNGSGLGEPTWRSRRANSTTRHPGSRAVWTSGPGDPAVWQAHLELAVATSDEPGFWRAVNHLPAGSVDTTAILRLRVWLMALRRDTTAEEKELVALINADPGDTKALERLASAFGRAESRQGNRRAASAEG